MIEIWSPVPNKPHYYVSTFGNVRYENNPIKKQYLDKYGYYNVCLYKHEGALVHRLVAKAFIPNPENKPQVNHIDGNKKNNHVENLEWVTHKENMEHASRNGLTHHKISVEERSKIAELYEQGYSTWRLAKMFDTKPNTILWWLEKQGIKRRPNVTKLTNEDIQDICDLYEQGYSSNELGKMYDLSNSAILKFLHRNNVKTRSYTSITKEDIEYINELYEIGFNLTEIGSITGRCYYTIKRYLNKKDTKNESKI